MKTLTTEPIDLTDCGPVMDCDGSLKYDNLGDALECLFFKESVPPKRQKVVVKASRVGGRGEEEYQYEVKRTYTVGYLCRLWKANKGENFTIERYRQMCNEAMEGFEREARQRSAWGAFISSSRAQGLQKEEREYQERSQRLSPAEAEKADKEREEKLSQCHVVLYIA